jgi:hypothetical protein
MSALTGLHFFLNAMVFPRLEGMPEWLYRVFRFLLIYSCTFFPIAWESQWIIADIKRNRSGAKHGKHKIIRLSWPEIFKFKEEEEQP